MEVLVFLRTFDAISITVGVTTERPDKPDPNGLPIISLNYNPATAHALAEEVLIPYAKPEHCLIAFEMGENVCEVCVWLVVPMPGGLAVAGNIADIDLVSIGRFLDAKAKYGAYGVGLGYHDNNMRITRRADLNWNLVVSQILPRKIVDERMTKLVFSI